MAATPTNKDPVRLPIWKELIEDERRYREKLIKVRAKKRRMPTPAECLDAMKEVLAEKRFEKAKAELTRGGGLVSRRFEWCKNWCDIVEEWDEIMWRLPTPAPEQNSPVRSDYRRDDIDSQVMLDMLEHRRRRGLRIDYSTITPPQA